MCIASIDMFQTKKPSGKKIMIVIEESAEMLSRRCNVSRYVTLIEAAGFIAYYFSRIESGVKLYSYRNTGMKSVTIPKESNVKQFISSLKTDDVLEVVSIRIIY